MSSKKIASQCRWQETVVNNSSRTPVHSNSEMMGPQRIQICINTVVVPEPTLRILRSVDESQWTRIWLGSEVNKTGKKCSTVSKMSQASYNNSMTN
jgi:hypothetical protein